MELQPKPAADYRVESLKFSSSLSPFSVDIDTWNYRLLVSPSLGR